MIKNFCEQPSKNSLPYKEQNLSEDISQISLPCYLATRYLATWLPCEENKEIQSKIFLVKPTYIKNQLTFYFWGRTWRYLANLALYCNYNVRYRTLQIRIIIIKNVPCKILPRPILRRHLHPTGWRSCWPFRLNMTFLKRLYHEICIHNFLHWAFSSSLKGQCHEVF